MATIDGIVSRMPVEEIAKALGNEGYDIRDLGYSNQLDIFMLQKVINRRDLLGLLKSVIPKEPLYVGILHLFEGHGSEPPQWFLDLYGKEYATRLNRIVEELSRQYGATFHSKLESVEPTKLKISWGD